MPNDETIAALRAERAGLLSRGLNDRVAQVDAALRFYGADLVAAIPEAALPSAPPGDDMERSVPTPPTETRRNRK